MCQCSMTTREGDAISPPKTLRRSWFTSLIVDVRLNHSLETQQSGANRGERHENLRAQAMSTTTQGTSPARTSGNLKNDPDHLLVLVHGIWSSPSDWTYAEEELKRHLGKSFLIYASSSNAYTKTFTGIDEAGKRLADEVMQVVKKTKSLKRISFLAHSLGGLFARYAIALLYSPDTYNSGQPSDPANCVMENSQRTDFSKGMIAGLEPMSFITLATPHLGLPFLFGVPILEKLVAPIAPLFIGRTGTQLFLTDDNPNKPSLLLRMASDCEDGKFISALGAFRCRVVYANVSYDHMVGWRTSSIRREVELGKPPRQSLDGYKHVVDVKFCPPVPSDGPQFPPEAVKAKETAQHSQNNVEFHEIMEEDTLLLLMSSHFLLDFTYLPAKLQITRGPFPGNREEMIQGLQRLGWIKVDVNFHSAVWPLFAHSNIHVKKKWLHNAGVGVVAHVVDSLKQQETSSILPTS
ncbi:hypothetical protein L195_g010847 [Trifolium pratense]|uniref:DUF676 domain-containing protein n=2 Tax=Trifolium TaxID=3898 RepID=A0A2K3PFU6_TRIPR|nr:hypothetical protein L195_g010847 [Trifolium pratense]